ncbi:MAG TPA: maleylpyruvate isomerase N-terminal domain-containing protein [Actinomycetota bacterium]
MALDLDTGSLLAGLETTHGQLGRLLADLEAASWALPVPATPGWSVGDLVSHVAEGDRAALAALGGTPSFDPASWTGIDDWTAAQVAAHAAERPEERLAAWEAASDELRGALAGLDEAGWRARVLWVLGPVSARTVAQLRLQEAWLHGHDLAGAAGASWALDPVTLGWIADIAARVIPGGLSRRGQAKPGAVILLRLDGLGEWRLGGTAGERPAPDATPDLVLEAEPLPFILRAAGRRRDIPWHAAGDEALAAAVAATIFSVG